MPRGVGGGGGGQWTDTNDRLMLLTIIHLAAPSLPKWEEVAALMNQGFTGNAIRQRFQKLRNECKDKFGEPDGESKKATTRKPKPSTAIGGTPGRATGKRKARKQREASDDEETEHVVKKIKTEEKEDCPEKEDSE